MTVKKPGLGALAALSVLLMCSLCMPHQVKADTSWTDETPLMTITAFDYGNGAVNGGDSVLIESAGSYLLMDTENYDSTGKIIKYLKRNNISTLSLYLSHWHEDHFYYLWHIMNDPYFTVTRLYIPATDWVKKYGSADNAGKNWYKWSGRCWEGVSYSGKRVPGVYGAKQVVEKAAEKNIPVTYLKKGSSFVVGNAHAKVLWYGCTCDMDDSFFPYGNDRSLVTKITAGGTSYLTAGDISAEVYSAMEKAGVNLAADILKISHHGASETAAIVRRINPEYAFYQDSKETPGEMTMTAKRTEISKVTNLLSVRCHGDITFSVFSKDNLYPVVAETERNSLQKTKQGSGGKNSITTLIEKKLPAGEEDPANSQYFFFLQEKASGTDSISLQWGAVNGATFYVYGSKCGAPMKFIGTTTGTAYTHKGLDPGGFYHYTVFAVKNNAVVKTSKTAHIATGNGWTNAKSITLNTGDRTILPGKGYNLAVTDIPENPSAKTESSPRFYSTNSNVASVNASGRITARNPGRCDIYVFARNGRYTKIAVTVREMNEAEKRDEKAAGIIKNLLKGKSEDDLSGSAFAPLCMRMSGTSVNSISLAWNKAAEAEVYHIYGAKCGEAPVRLGITAGTGFTHKNLKSGTLYRYNVFAVRKDGTLVKVSRVAHIATVGSIANVKTLALNKTDVTLNKGSAFTLKTSKVLDGKGREDIHRNILFASSNASVASVTAGGKITARTKGTCNIYVYAQDGTYARCSVTVK